MPNTPKAVDREALKEFRKRNDQRYVLEGEYSPITKVGESDVANNLKPYSENSGIAQHEPFVFQSTGGSSDVFALCQLKALRGQSYVLNQLLNTFVSKETVSGVTVTASNSGKKIELSDSANSYFTLTKEFGKTIPIGHKLLVKGNFSNTSSINNSLLGFRIRSADNLDITKSFADTNNFNYIYTTTIDVDRFQLYGPNTGDFTGISLENIQVFDLTQMFGAGNEPTTVEEFNRLFPLPYYEYNAGELVSCQASKLITVGYNAYDNANPTDFIKVVAGQTYTLEGNYTSVELYDADKNLLADSFVSESALPNNCCYVKIIGGDDTTCFHLTWDGGKTGYEPYKKHEYGLPNEVLRSAGSVYDEIKSNGTKITRIGTVDLGTLTWEYQSSSQRFISYNQVGQKGVSANTIIANIRCSKYTSVAQAQTGGNSDKNIAIYLEETPYIYVTDKDYSDAAAFKSAMSGVYLFFELATPVESESIAFQENIAIDNWGTMEFVSTYPQGNDLFYYVDYKAFVDSLGNREDIGFDASKIVSHDELAEALADVDLSDYAEKSMVGFPVIPVPASTTLTADEKAQIVKGVCINGSFLGYNNIVLFPAVDYGGTYYGKFYAGGRPSYEGVYQIGQNNQISLPTDQNIRLSGIERINGKAIPAYPSNTGTFVLKCVNGTLTWVQE